MINSTPQESYKNCPNLFNASRIALGDPRQRITSVQKTAALLCLLLPIACAKSGPAVSADSPAAIHQEVSINAPPARVYEALTTSAQFAALTGTKCEISPDVGGPFSCFNGIITGRNLEMVPARRLVQAWRDKPWPAGLYSNVNFELRAEGPGTRIIFDHTGFPPEDKPHLASGWHEHYWTPLKKYLEH